METEQTTTSPGFPLPITIDQALCYEVSSSRWVSLIPVAWLQDAVGRYFERKTRRKYRRYLAAQEFPAVMYGNQTQNDERSRRAD